MMGHIKCRTFALKLECVILDASILLKPHKSKNSEKNEIKMYSILPKSVDLKQFITHSFVCDDRTVSCLDSKVNSKTNIKTIIL